MQHVKSTALPANLRECACKATPQTAYCGFGLIFYDSELQPCSGNLGRTDQTPFFFYRFYILRQMLETCAPMTFPDFQKLMEWCQSYFAKISLKAYMGVYGYHTTHGYLICIKFSSFNMSMQFSVQNQFGQVWPPIPYV